MIPYIRPQITKSIVIIKTKPLEKNEFVPNSLSIYKFSVRLSKFPDKGHPGIIL